jgi:AcrR family transcriptional regulator
MDTLLEPVTRRCSTRGASRLPGRGTVSHNIAAMPQRAGKRRPGRRPGDSGTRHAILAAARGQFAERGWDRATIRAIAKDADVDPALVLHYFGSKAVLFTAAMTWPFDTDAAVDQVVTGPRGQLGRRLASFFLSIWEDPVRREPIMVMLRAATTNAQAAELLRETLLKLILGPVGSRIGMPDAELRMSLCSTQLLGLGIGRYIVGFEPLASLEPERVVDLVGPALQRYMTGRI